MKKLKKIYIEITNVCNLSCAFCPGTSRAPHFMSTMEFRTILDKLSGWTDHLYFHVMGEPLLNPEIGRFLEWSGDCGFMVNLTTNGVRIAERAEELLAGTALRQVNFSLHSQEELQDGIQLERYLEDIFAFSDKALARGDIYISFRLWNLRSQAAAAYNRIVAEKLEEHFHPLFSVSEAMEQRANEGSVRIKLGGNLYLNGAEVFDWPSLDAEDVGDDGFCLGLRDQAGILSDGTVVPCCLDGGGVIGLGNIFENDFGEILAGERARALYEGFSNRHAVEELCRKCGYRMRFSSNHKEQK